MLFYVSRQTLATMSTKFFASKTSQENGNSLCVYSLRQKEVAVGGGRRVQMMTMKCVCGRKYGRTQYQTHSLGLVPNQISTFIVPHTDLSSLIGNFDCGYSTVWKLSHFPPLKTSKIPKHSKFRAAHMVTMAICGLQNDKNRFHVKSEWQKNLKILTLYFPNQAAQVCTYSAYHPTTF